MCFNKKKCHLEVEVFVSNPKDVTNDINIAIIVYKILIYVTS